MTENSRINSMIIQVVEQYCDDVEVIDLIKSALQYELDIWNRHIFPSSIKEEYESMVERTIKKGKK